ncbi:Zinc knuckle family protein, putative isoform 2 [Hibiscus syriacus]|uniref:Zinc knuckle family protein, putative isoform 2 n=1 Tax=Hibiscus syriacus TaxID=106335 RepID=A0A6A3BVA0_HIBSY|nr:TIMELESS-interacting protein-like [Hibiscus syriacus]KAE8719821.1 Zinc knuckle family protein, putative isoform 2 [Hibiscus syriacus]
MENANSAPTGCYKCGRTGHWSHDCPDAPKSDPPNPRRVGSDNPNSTGKGCYKCGRPGHWARDCPDLAKSDQPNPNASSSGTEFTSNPLPRPEKPKKVAKSRTRPKLTPELLLSDDGLGYVLRHFPRAFRYRGRGHEVSDLGKLIELYREWHKHLIPYYSFDQFVHKVDKVASSKRVKNCIKDLRERVARGGDPTKFHESPDEFNPPTDEQVAGRTGAQTHDHHEGDHVDEIQESMLNEIYQKVSEEPSHVIHTPTVAAEALAAGDSEAHEQMLNTEANCSTEIHITEEQRTRMEANKAKALERAAAASSIRITEEQRSRMEANRLKALERAAARARSLHSA